MSNLFDPARSTRLRTPQPTRLSAMRNVFAFALFGLLLAAGVASADASPAARAPLDLNRATAEELESLPGIGAAKAAAILEVREQNGGFSSLDELESVRGIGPALLAKLRPLVVVGVGAAKGGTARAGAPKPAAGATK
jgi:competence ComEA-like helix-hairpin-helix protein